MILAVSFLAIGLVSCKDDSDENGDMAENVSYDIIFPAGSDKSLEASANALKNKIEQIAGVKFNVRDDRVESGEDVSSKKEILIGNTDRVESKALRAKLDGVNNEKAFAIEANANKICIIGKNVDITVRAVKYFVNNYVSLSEESGTLTLPTELSMARSADTGTTIFPETLTELRFGKKQNVFSSNDIMSEKSYYYPTAVILEHQANPADNGKIIATLNSSEHFYSILESTDDGESFKEITQVYDRVNANCRGGRMPMLYELPADMGSYKKGTLVLAGTSSALTSSSDEKSAIVIYYSADAGKTWTAGQSIDFGAGRTDGDGIWEPFLIYEQETGRLYCFYSDDRDSEHDQKIVYKYTTDLISWTGAGGVGSDKAPFEAVASSDYKPRPGMVSITKMSNGEYIMVYEVGHSKYGDSTATVHFKKSKKLDDWSDVSDIGEQIISVDGRAFGSAPWCAYTPVGGQNGLFITTGRYRDDRNTDPSEPDLFISFDYGETFVTIENPFDYENSDLHLGKFGYSPFLLTAGDGKTIYYFNTSFFKPLNQTQCIEMVKIEIIP